MHLFVLALFTAATSAVSVSYDTGYDDSTRSLTAVTCSDGTNGLITRYGWQTQGSVSRFPHIGGADAVDRWNSPNVSRGKEYKIYTNIPTNTRQCGTCWQLTYNGRSINVLAIDHAASGFNIAKTALNDLTNGQAVSLGRIDATATQVGLSNCGL